jgi:hypothetical protein
MISTTSRRRLAAPDRHPSKRPVPEALFHFDVRRPASTIRSREAAETTRATI